MSELVDTCRIWEPAGGFTTPATITEAVLFAATDAALLSGQWIWRAEMSAVQEPIRVPPAKSPVDPVSAVTPAPVGSATVTTLWAAPLRTPVPEVVKPTV